MAADSKKRYRFFSGEDTPEFCARVSTALDEGYALYGNPVMIMDGNVRIVGQAVVLVDTQAGEISVREED